MQTQSMSVKKGPALLRSQKKRTGLKLFLMALPFVLVVVAFAYVPLAGWAYAFFDYRPGIPLSETAFTGLKVFGKMWANRAEIARVMRNTLVLSFMGIVTSPLPMIFAILLNEIKSNKFKRLVQTVATLPNFISWIVVFSLAFAMFSSDGMVNSLLRLLGMGPIDLLGNAEVAWAFQWALATWKTLGWSAIIYIAAITGIDTALYDAAHVDGANRFQSIIHITLPGLSSTYFVLLLLSISNILSNGFEQYFVFYNPMVAEKIEVLDYYVYRVGVLTNDYPQSIALWMMKTLISVALLFTANNLSRRVRGEPIV